jgi:hypothetical protein
MECDEMIEETAPQITRDLHSGELCRHYWMIDEPSGPVSKGMCRMCHEVREFKNFIDETPWTDDSLIPEAADWEL